ncbi:MAG TPA: hypothetical protein PLI27_00695 [Ignavibacteriales bacterium]|nr:hypothetical protein [Ignavibacteriales bacterium]HOL80202.1 hypothetical protein [Ignavibacteriales bacterium]HOM64484.1 hypothetical protein [Ignavibacteriales bacterium]HPD66581.1 hypothetical protein [Ignavibacteriales bacterium]HPP32391.1 hypothetical protein [Ignavibacteriales bacterium]
MKKIITFILTVKFLFAAVSLQLDTLNINEIFIYPYETDTNIREWNEPHQILFRKKAKPKQLILFFQGSYGKPGGYKYFKSSVLDSQNMIIDLRYPNDWLTFEKCQAVLDEHIFDKFRYEIMFGKNLHLTIKVDTSNSLMNRFKKLLYYLKNNTTIDVNFLFDDNGNIDYSKITVCGFSQGAGMALLFGGLHPVNRIVLFAGPVDSNFVMKKVASWVTDSINISNKNIYGLLNKYDYYYNYTLNVWKKIGGHKYDIITNEKPNISYRNNFVISHIKHKDSHIGILLDDNYPIYLPLWRWLVTGKR